MTDSTITSLPRTAKICILAYILIAFAVAGFVGMSNGKLGFGSPELLVILSALVCASWLRPIMMFSDGASQAHHMDEGFFVLMSLLLPPAGAVIAFVIATSLAQMIKRRAAVKSIFNVSQIVLSTSCGLLAARLIAAPRGHITLAQLGAAAVGAGVYFVVNSLSLAVILSMTGSASIRSAVFDGLEVRGRMLGGSVSLGLVSAVALRNVPFSAPIIVLPFIAFRQALSGHFQARHDRGRLLGLFEATLAVNHTMGTKDVEDALRRSAASLLRGRDASIALTEPPADTPAMAVPLDVAGRRRWLTVNGRNRSEPFDAADKTLLEALAATGSSALENSSLYEERRREEERLVAITSNLDEGVCAFDAAGRLTFMNPAAAELLGVKAEEVIGLENGVDELEILTSTALRSLHGGEHMKEERTVFARRGAGTFPVEVTCLPIVSQGVTTGAVLAFRDISERLAAEELLEFHAFHDALTSLPNRTIFLDRLQHALHGASRTGETHAVLFADVDRFKLTNDSLGHHAGDELLVCIANRLRPIIREGDTLARFGGDEFTILLENVGGVEAAESLATRILEAVRRPITLDDGRIILASLSIGIALATAGVTADDVLHDADVAMYQAKHRGTGLYQTFDAIAMGNRSAEWLDLEIALRRAIENEELTVHYQPIVATDSGRIVGAEALVRWEHPRRGTLLPSDFIGLAEETGLILPIGRRVLEQACNQAREWSDSGMPINVAVNLSARQFQQHDLGRDVRAVLAASGLPPSQLCLEITESLAMADIERTIHLLVDLKYLGVRLAIDDFGTGYSSLNYLKRFPIDIVKLDRTFVQELDVSTVDTAIVSAVVNLAEVAGMTTVAEGVETPDQLARLIGMGCPMVQGYHLARPMPAEALTALLRKHLGGTGMDLQALQMPEPSDVAPTAPAAPAAPAVAAAAIGLTPAAASAAS